MFSPRNQRNPNWLHFAAASSDQHGDGRVHFASAAIRGVTLAAFKNIGFHALLCRDLRITAQVSLWLDGHRALKMVEREPHHSVKRPSRAYFEPWDGKPASVDDHIV